METRSATQLLINDHKTIHGLFSQARAIGFQAGPLLRGVIRELFMKLEIHATIEEEIFYPALRERPDLEIAVRAMLESSFQEHAEVRQTVARLRSEGIENPSVWKDLEELRLNVESHIENEERELLPVAERLLTHELTALGEKMSARMQELMARPSYWDSLPEQGQNAGGGEQKRKEVA